LEVVFLFHHIDLYVILNLVDYIFVVARKVVINT
jgi:hypothetical protein